MFSRARLIPYRWLASVGRAIELEARTGFRAAKISIASGAKVGFTHLTNLALGIQFTNILTFQKISLNHNLLNGAGLATGDFDGDGWSDLYFCGLGGRNALYRNLGNWRFEDVTDQAGVACTNQFSTGAVFADINGDRRPDLLVTSCGGPNACFINAGNGRFNNVTEAAGLLSKYGSTSMALADIDGDGDLDLYVANYGENTIRSGLNITTRVVGGKETVTGRYANRIKIINGRLIEYGEPHALYLNDGAGKFTPVSWTEGGFLDANGNRLASIPWDMGLSVQFRDLNGDGAPDIYVCNDFQTPDRIWINDGRGHFRALAPGALSHTSHFSMTMDSADINRDGLPDFFVADMERRSHRDRMRQMAPADVVLAPGETHDHPQVRRNTLWLNRGDGTWLDIANYAGVGATDWTWCSVFLDVDLDGFEDLLIANGHAYDTEDMDATEALKALGKQRPQDSRTNLVLFPKLEVPNALLRNRGDLTFEEVSTRWGFDSRQVSHGIALADFDNDGDLDAAVNCLNAPPLIYRNESSQPRLAVKLKGTSPNTQGIGAKVELLGGPLPQTQEIISGGPYLSGSEPMRVFAARDTTEGMVLKVGWRNGKQTIVTNVMANHIYELDESAARAGSAHNQHPSQPLFEDLSHVLNHTHSETTTDDFARQPLLPRRISESGPGAGWITWNTNETESVVIAARDERWLATYRFVDGKFERNLVSTPDPALSGLALWSDAQGASLQAGLTSHEPAQSEGLRVMQLRAGAPLTAGRLLPPKRLAIGETNPSALAAADYDADGDLDLFVGGQSNLGRYPEASKSLLFRTREGELEIDQANSTQLANAGLVNGAVFSDLDGDGLPELILAVEWGPIRVFRNQAGRFTDVTSDLGLAEFTGWWQGVTTGDFNNDGRLDIVASNWGLNSTYRASPRHPTLLHYGDFAGAGGVDMLEAEWDPEQSKVVPRRPLQDVAAALPFVRARFSSHRAYAETSVRDVLGEVFSKSHELKAATLASMVFLNRGGRFEPLPLPPEAQFAPAFGVSVADFDGDGNEDIFLAQNFSGTQLNMPPLRQGRGLILLGNGKGHFTAMTSQDSGIKILGDQRGAAAGDFDEDGRVDLVVAQNNAATKLFHNVRAKPGVRVILAGPPQNPNAIGAVIRAKVRNSFGPAREIHAGSGYRSQDSVKPVLCMSESPAKIWIRWPGGKITETEVPAGSRVVHARFDSK